MKNTDTEFLERWEVHRISRWKFILIHGVIYWGLPVWVLTRFIDMLLEKKTFSHDFELWYFSLPVWMLSGLLFGWLLWLSNEKKYKKFKIKN